MSVSAKDDPLNEPVRCETAAEALKVAEGMKSVAAAAEQPLDAQELLQKYPAIGAVVNDPTLTPFQKKLRVAPLFKNALNNLTEERDAVAAELRAAHEEEAKLQRYANFTDRFLSWSRGEMRLQKNETSRLHHLRANVGQKQKFYHMSKTGEFDAAYFTDMESLPWEELQSFVVQHDWLAAFTGAEDFDSSEDIRLPAEWCAFEFKFDGAWVTMICHQGADEGGDVRAWTFASLPGTELWCLVALPSTEGKSRALAHWSRHVKAVCVALEAQVAEHSVTRAPSALNKKRAKAGKLPLYDYHVVKLADRRRIANPLRPAGGASGRRHRLHFRRGHWRQYSSHRTWVRWTLVGDPELGFIDKEYRL